MRAVWTILATSLALGGCAGIPEEPVRIVDQSSDVSTCRSLGDLGPPVRADGPGYAVAYDRYPTNLAASLPGWRQRAVELGATDILLVRKPYRDWSWVEARAYRCREPGLTPPLTRRG